MIEQEAKQYLRDIIINDVFVTSDDKVIMEKNGNESRWLFDFRSVLLDSTTLDTYADFFLEKYKHLYPFQICGLEVAAIPLVSAIVMKSVQKGIPVNGFFIRKSRKKSGLLNMIEGKISDDPVILVDDIINSGGTYMRQVEVLEKMNTDGQTKAHVSHTFSILRFRDLSYYTYFHNKDIAVDSIFELNDFKNVLPVSNLNKKDEKQRVHSFESVWRWVGNKPNLFYVVPKSAPLYHGNKLYFGTDSGHFVCLDSRTGNKLWEYLVPFGSKGKIIFSSPCYASGMVYFGAYDGNVYALDAETGKRKWVFMEADWVGASPCVAYDKNLLFIGMEYGLFNKHGGVTALHAKTGEKVWEYRSKALTHGSPAYSKKYNVVCCGSNDKMIHVLNAKTGELLWNLMTESEIKYAPYIDEDKGRVIFGGIGGDSANESKSSIYVCDIKTGSVLARYMDLYFGIYSTPVMYKNLVIVSSLDKCIHAFDVNTGQSVWKYNTGARVFATPSLIEIQKGVWRVMVGSNNARLHELDPETGECIETFLLTERIINKIAFDKETGMIFVPTFANEIFAIRKKQI